MAVPDYVRRLRSAVERAAPLLLAMPEERAARRPAPGKWSAKEVVGHLVDSASNNHPRFVRAQMQDDLVFPGYAQDDWVRLQRYQDASWPDLVGLFRTFNAHVAHVMATAPEAVRLRPRPRHNLHELGFASFDAARPASLDDLMRDYVDHLEHHLGRVLAKP